MEERRAAPGTLELDTLKEAVKVHYAAEEGRVDPSIRDALNASKEAEIRAMYASSGYTMSPDMLTSAMSSPRTVDITLLTTPKPPRFETVSFYGDPSAMAKRRPINPRATALCHACGHPPTHVIHGDVFLGRCVDDEMGDVWERRSIKVEEAVADCAWVKEASRANAGKNTSTYSSSGLMAQLKGGGEGEAGGGEGGGEAGAAAATKAAGGGAPAEGLGWKESDPGNPLAYTWRRNKGEIDIKQPLPPGTKSKDLIVTLTKDTLAIKWKVGTGEKPPFPGVIGSEGKLCGKIDVEYSSWEIEKGVLSANLSLLETSSFAWPRVFDKEL